MTMRMLLITMVVVVMVVMVLEVRGRKVMNMKIMIVVISSSVTVCRQGEEEGKNGSTPHGQKHGKITG